MFTREQILEIQTKLASLGYRDTDFDRISEIDGDELVAIVKDKINKVISINDMTAGIREAITLTLNGLIEQALMQNYTMSFSASFNGARGENGTITLSASLSFNGNKIEEPYDIKYYSASGAVVPSSFTDTVTEKSRTYTAKITLKGKEYTKTASFSTYYRTLYGFGTYVGSTFTLVQQATKILSTAAGRYTITNAAANTPIFMIMVPPDTSVPTSFTMGGAPAALDTVAGYSYNGLTYTVLYIGDYDKDVKLDITAS